MWVIADDGYSPDVYKASKYNNDCLPTWDVLYHKFYLRRLIEFDPTSTVSNLDIYWKLPRKKLFLGWCTNQLNMMRFENPNDDSYQSDNRNLMFRIVDEVDSTPIIDHVVSIKEHGLPIIYTQPNPNTAKFSIFQSENAVYFDIRKTMGRLKLECDIINDDGTVDKLNDEEMWDVVTTILKPVLKYYHDES